jgi:trk system potassium uptake protein TrkA
MKYIIVGLGNFGSSLAERLTRKGHEVIGVDSKMDKVEALKEKITHTICLDCTDPQAVTHLPFGDTDIVFVAIGENEGANIMATALMKQLKIKRLISRAISPLHQTVLEAMGVDEIVHPEEETAERWAKKLHMRGVVDSFELTTNYNIIEATTPAAFIGKTIQEIAFRKNYNIVLLTIIKMVDQKNIFGTMRKEQEVQGVVSTRTVVEDGDILVMYGNIKDIQAVLKDN